MKTWILAIILSVVAIAPTAYIVYYGYEDEVKNEQAVLTTVEFVKPPTSELKVGDTFEVRACKVIDGYRFGLFLEGNKQIEAHLSTATKDEATEVVIEWLNNTTTPVPTVKLLRKTGSFWIVDFRLTVNGKTERVIELLKAKNLLVE